MTEDSTTPKIHIDSDWKAEAQAEKERLAQKEERAPRKPGAGRPGATGYDLPEANFRTLISMLGSQALMGLGTMQDPQTRGVVVDLEGARFSIDLLAVVEEKTKGNLSDEEAAEARQLLAELRARFVQVANLLARSVAASETGEKPPAETGPVKIT